MFAGFSPYSLLPVSHQLSGGLNHLRFMEPTSIALIFDSSSNVEPISDDYDSTERRYRNINGKSIIRYLRVLRSSTCGSCSRKSLGEGAINGPTTANSNTYPRRTKHVSSRLFFSTDSDTSPTPQLTSSHPPPPYRPCTSP